MFLPPVTHSPHFSPPRYSSRLTVSPNLASHPSSNWRPSYWRGPCSPTSDLSNARWPTNAPFAENRPTARRSDLSGCRKEFSFIFNKLRTFCHCQIQLNPFSFTELRTYSQNALRVRVSALNPFPKWYLDPQLVIFREQQTTRLLQLSSFFIFGFSRNEPRLVVGPF